MTNWKRKIAVNVGEYIGRDMMKKITDFTNELENWTSKNPFNARLANPADEDEYMKKYNRNKIIPIPTRKPSIPKTSPMQREVSTWSKEDLDKVMGSKDYRYDNRTQQKVKSYFDWKYPGSQKSDITGRPY